MADDKGGRELTPRHPDEVEPADSPLTTVEGENRDVERFSAGPRAHSVGLTEERSAQIVRQSANARNVVFLAILIIALFIPVYWFYESGIPALGSDGRLAAEADAQYVTDVARGYELYIANCATCHGAEGQGGVGPRLNDQAKLYNVLTPAGDPGSGHLNPDYLDNVLTVGGRYVCGDPNSLMAAWREPNGPLNYRQVEELIAWMTASSDVIFPRHIESHGEADEEHSEPEDVSGWRDPDWEPAPDATPPPACWKNPGGVIGGGTAPAATPAAVDPGTTEPIDGGTSAEPRIIKVEATSSLQFLDENGNKLERIDAVEGEIIEFVVDNTAGSDHNFWIGAPEDLQVMSGETDTGIETWQSGVETLTWEVPAAGGPLQFACTVPGHYTLMNGDIVISAGAPADAAAPDEPADPATDEAATPAEPATPEEPAGAATGGTPEEPRVIQIEATAALQFLDENGNKLANIDAVEGETIEFVVNNSAGSDHNFWIGAPEDLQVMSAETDTGIETWQSGEQTLTWTVPAAGGPLQFACTVPGHYSLMNGDIVISS